MMTDPNCADKLLTQALIHETAQAASDSPRHRKNYNFHALEERVQRFINAMQPGTYVRPHCHHRDPEVSGFEFFLVLQGEVGILIFNQRGQVIRQYRVSGDGPLRAIELPEGTYHTLVALTPNTAMLEIKEGPYNAQTDKDFMARFPEEGTPEAEACVAAWEHHFQKSAA
ncbi:MAG: WbuC family cupin fold metalloprotein [Cyanobacteria bacterium P01_A01_bin.135]